jgi:hypothetical protein
MAFESSSYNNNDKLSTNSLIRRLLFRSGMNPFESLAWVSGTARHFPATKPPSPLKPSFLTFTSSPSRAEPRNLGTLSQRVWWSACSAPRQRLSLGIFYDSEGTGLLSLRIGDKRSIHPTLDELKSSSSVASKAQVSSASSVQTSLKYLLLHTEPSRRTATTKRSGVSGNPSLVILGSFSCYR